MTYNQRRVAAQIRRAHQRFIKATTETQRRAAQSDISYWTLRRTARLDKYVKSL